MDAEQKTNTNILTSREKPKSRELLDNITNAINNAQVWYSRVESASNTIWTRWANQFPDGKKHAREDDMEAPIPWEGASDTRVSFAIEKIKEASAIQANAYAQANLKITGREGLDHINAQKATNLLKWTLSDLMGNNAREAMQLSRFYRNGLGFSIMSVEWDRQVQVILDDVPFELFANQIGSPIPQGGSLPMLLEAKQKLESALANPFQVPPEQFNAAEQKYRELYEQYKIFFEEELRDQLYSMIQEEYPKCNLKRAKKAFEDWSNGEVAKIPQEKVVKECPKWTALLPFEDIFFPVWIQDIQSSPWFAVREWLTEQEVRSLGKAQNWNEKFIEKVLESKGQNSTLSVRKKLELEKFDMVFNSASASLENDDRCEILYMYYRALDEDDSETLYRMVLSPHVGKENDDNEPLYGVNEIYQTPDGQYPFYPLCYYRTDKTLLDNIGIAYLARFPQNTIKNLRDRRFDAADISILPPIRRDARASRDALILGPASIIYENGGETQWMNPPNTRYDLGVDLENAERRDVARIVGSSEAGVAPDLIASLQGEQVLNYLGEMRDILKATWRLIQEYMPPMTVMRTTGSLTMPYQISADEIRGAFDLDVDFDPANLDQAMQEKKFGLLMQLIARDTNGTIDTNLAIKFVTQMIFPTLADRLITDESQATQKSILEEKQNIALMMTGQSAALKQQESGAKLRLQTIQQEMQTNPVIMQAYNSVQRIREAFDQRLQNLNMQLMQEQNKMIGALGVNPNLGN